MDGVELYLEISCNKAFLNISWMWFAKFYVLMMTMMAMTFLKLSKATHHRIKYVYAHCIYIYFSYGCIKIITISIKAPEYSENMRNFCSFYRYHGWIKNMLLTAGLSNRSIIFTIKNVRNQINQILTRWVITHKNKFSAQHDRTYAYISIFPGF